MTAYSDAVAAAKARMANGAGAQRQIGELAVGFGDENDDGDRFGGADVHTTGGGNATPHQDFSEIVADATLGVDGEGKKPGAPAGQQKTKTKVGGDVVTTETRKFAKVEGISHGIVFGYGIVCKEDGKDYFDVQGDHIPEESMLSAAADFAKGARPGKDMHSGSDVGQHVFMFPLTTEIAKALGIKTEKTGLLLGYAPPPDMLAKFVSGEYTGFSIGGERGEDEEVA
jgi:hypothetical protein